VKRVLCASRLIAVARDYRAGGTCFTKTTTQLRLFLSEDHFTWEVYPQTQ
jgi:hypothetical protein